MSLQGAIDAGQTLGKYTLQRELGRGSMGVVFLAIDGALRREVAIKILNAGLTSDPRFEEWFRTEAQSVAAIYHPGIVRVHAFDSLDRQLLIDMEYVPGGALSTALAKRGVTAQEAVRIGLDMLDALACCHEAGIIHRDIKPTNILLDARGAAKLSDFGLARILEHQLEASIRSAGSSAYFLGTPRYAPPEAWDGAAGGPAWDLYSLGMVLYEALTGSTPYRAVTPLALIKEMASLRIQPVRAAAPHVSEALGEIVDSLISHDPERRGGSAAEVSEALRRTPEAALADAPSGPTVRMPLPSVGERRRSRRERRRSSSAMAVFWGALGGAAVIALLAGAAVYGGLLAVAPATPAEPASEPAGFVSQDDAGVERVPPAHELPRLTHGEPPGAVYDVLLYPIEMNLAAAALMTRNGAGETRLLVRTENAVWSMDLAESAGGVSVTGRWADYQGVAGGVLRMGGIDGSGRRVETPEAWIFTLALTNDLDHGVTEKTLTLTRNAGAADTAFWLGLESAPLVPALLSNELIERRLDWAEAIEARLPAVTSSRVAALPLSDAAAPFVHDGILDESWWRQSGYAGGVPECVLPGRPWNGGGLMIVRIQDERLLIGFQVPRPAAEALVLRLAVGGRTAAPIALTQGWRAAFREGQGLVAAESRSGGAWDCPWAFADGRSDRGWEAEVVIPLDSVLSRPGPRTPPRIRVNARIDQLDARGGEDVVAQWGHPDVPATEHGAIIVVAGPVQ